MGKHALKFSSGTQCLSWENGKTMGKQSHFDTGYHHVSLTITKLLNN